MQSFPSDMNDESSVILICIIVICPSELCRYGQKDSMLEVHRMGSYSRLSDGHYQEE